MKTFRYSPDADEQPSGELAESPEQQAEPSPDENVSAEPDTSSALVEQIEALTEQVSMVTGKNQELQQQIESLQGQKPAQESPEYVDPDDPIAKLAGEVGSVKSMLQEQQAQAMALKVQQDVGRCTSIVGRMVDDLLGEDKEAADNSELCAAVKADLNSIVENAIRSNPDAKDGGLSDLFVKRATRAAIAKYKKVAGGHPGKKIADVVEQQKINKESISSQGGASPKPADGEEIPTDPAEFERYQSEKLAAAFRQATNT